MGIAKMLPALAVLGALILPMAAADVQAEIVEHITKRKDCVEKTLERKTLEGIYLGTDCGDYCHTTIRLAGGKEVTLLCNVDADKVFRNAENRKVRVDIELQQFWMPEGDAPEPGNCVREDLLVRGTVLKR